MEPLTGAHAARDVELASRRAARDYIRQVREAGHGWEQIGQALGLAPGADADQAGLTVAEAAQRARCGVKTVYREVRAGRLRAVTSSTSAGTTAHSRASARGVHTRWC